VKAVKVFMEFSFHKCFAVIAAKDLFLKIGKRF
jgi:hypothetical protein